MLRLAELDDSELDFEIFSEGLRKREFNMYALREDTNEIVWPCQVTDDIKNILKCPGCYKHLNFRQGSKRPHFAHKPNEAGSCNVYSDRSHGGGESIYHFAAKFLLYKYLKDGHKIKASSVCSNCFDDIEHIISKETFQFDDIQIEYSCINGTADIALLRNGIIIALIEIRYTHATKLRHEFYFEFSAETILLHLAKMQHSDIIPTTIQLKNTKRIKCDDPNCLSFLTIAKYLGYYDNPKLTLDIDLNTYNIISATCNMPLKYDVIKRWNVECTSIMKCSLCELFFRKKKRCIHCGKKYKKNEIARIFCSGCYIKFKICTENIYDYLETNIYPVNSMKDFEALMNSHSKREM